MDLTEEDELYAGGEEGAARLFFLVFNTSTTLTNAQAVALVLGLTALIGGIAAAAYFFLLTSGTGSHGTQSF